MIKINLLKKFKEGSKKGLEDFQAVEEKAKESPFNDFDTEVLLKAAGFIVVLLIPWSLYFVYKLNTEGILKEEKTKLSKELTTVTKQYTVLLDKKKKLNLALTKLSGAEEKIEVLRNLFLQRKKKLDAFNTLQDYLNEGIWLTSIDYRQGKFDIKGYSEGNTLVTSLTDSLLESQKYSNVQVTDLQSATNFGPKTKLFSIVADIEGYANETY